MDSKLIGLKIKQLRSEHGLKIGKGFFQKDLAEALKISRGYLGDIESGRTKPNDDLLKKIALFFNVPMTVFDDEHSVGFYINFKKLKALRKIRKVTQEELSSVMGLNDSDAIGKIERVEIGVSPELLEKLASYFNVSTDFLRNNEDVTECPICKLRYAPLDNEDNLEHESFHKNTLKSTELVDTNVEFTEPEAALKFILKQPAFMAYGGYDLEKLSDDEILEIANDMLFAMKLSVEKLKKKK